MALFNHGHDQTLIVSVGGEPIYNSVRGQRQDPETAERLLEAVKPLIARARARFIASFSRLPSGLYYIERPKTGFTRSLYETGFAVFEGQPALVSVTAIGPEMKQFLSARRPPAVLVSLKKLNPVRLAALPSAPASAACAVSRTRATPPAAPT